MMHEAQIGAWMDRRMGWKRMMECDTVYTACVSMICVTHGNQEREMMAAVGTMDYDDDGWMGMAWQQYPVEYDDNHDY